MRIRWAQRGLGFSILILILCTAGFGQKKADDWAIGNAMIGPDAPIEISAGSSYQAQAMYPVPDGPLFPLKAAVVWSIAPPVKGISINAATGKIRVAPEVTHGTTATVLADVAGGKRKLTTKLYVFRPEENPLVGKWRVDQKVACGEALELKTATPGPRSLYTMDWSFHVDQNFWVGRTNSIAAGVRRSGTYEFEVKAATLKLTNKWPALPPSQWSFLLKDEGKTLLLHPAGPENGLEPGCAYVLHR
ncbi:MAG TPA: hypothetical protein VH724_20660 [Candidatus Angelobacter sp.]|nr:hypothetical protein [Candidatus Angelobacter sp.]